MTIRAKKSLGQNWLTNESVVRLMVSTSQIKKDERVLEVGPGRGKLTTALLQAGARVIAVEKDDRLISVLRQQFHRELTTGRLELIHHDILDFDPILINEPYKVVANLPYYISGEFLKRFLTTPNQPQKIVLMLQKEVAERIIARQKKESILSLSVKTYGKPQYIQTVARGNFKPAPKVDSAILAISHISHSSFKKNRVAEKKFFSILKRGFSQKRKKLKNNLSLPAQLASRYGDRRAEDLQLKDWFLICKQL